MVLRPDDKIDVTGRSKIDLADDKNYNVDDGLIVVCYLDGGSPAPVFR